MFTALVSDMRPNHKTSRQPQYRCKGGGRRGGGVKAPAVKDFFASGEAVAAKAASEVANSAAVIQKGFQPAKSVEEAEARLKKLGISQIKYVSSLNGMSLDQANNILARMEHLKALGFRQLALLETMNRKFDVDGGTIEGETRGGIITLSTRPRLARAGSLDTTNSIGDIFAHEYAHTVWNGLKPYTRSVIGTLQPPKTQVAKTLGSYATTNQDEWFAEALTVITRPGYKQGTIPYDKAIYRILKQDGAIKT